MTNDPEDKSAIVPVAQQAEAVAAHSVWRTAKPHVWTERMLTALVTGVKGGKWFRLIDKVYDERNLTAAFRQVEKNGGAAGVDHVSVREFAAQCPENIWQLADSLRAGLRSVGYPPEIHPETRHHRRTSAGHSDGT